MIYGVKWNLYTHNYDKYCQLSHFFKNSKDLCSVKKLSQFIPDVTGKARILNFETFHLEDNFSTSFRLFMFYNAHSLSYYDLSINRRLPKSSKLCCLSSSELYNALSVLVKRTEQLAFQDDLRVSQNFWGN